MVMTDIQMTKSFQAKVPMPLWDRFEAWMDGRGKLDNTQIICGLLRLFLASPEPLQLKALFGKSDNLHVLEGAQAGGLSPAECEEVRAVIRRQMEGPPAQVDAIRQVLHGMSPQDLQNVPGQIIEILSPEDSARLAEFRALHGPDQPATIGKSRPKKAKHG